MNISDIVLVPYVGELSSDGEDSSDEEPTTEEMLPEPDGQGKSALPSPKPEKQVTPMSCPQYRRCRVRIEGAENLNKRKSRFPPMRLQRVPVDSISRTVDLFTFCNNCRIEFGTDRRMLEHVQQVHTNHLGTPAKKIQVFRCRPCNRTYASSLRLAAHIFHRHVQSGREDSAQQLDAEEDECDECDRDQDQLCHHCGRLRTTE